MKQPFFKSHSISVNVRIINYLSSTGLIYNNIDRTSMNQITKNNMSDEFWWDYNFLVSGV